ncbi:CLUMA_CG014050, isoform A [Clunio marinus]|uniref:CLUMA_CG014050, isoform A n=1 Tax=Clunio marinus TaxID=568069 RepID=A0A1J1INY1_9DIPT|nr:CLUMA_CG014050, isoform A [Clunio marinus]
MPHVVRKPKQSISPKSSYYQIGENREKSLRRLKIQSQTSFQKKKKLLSNFKTFEICFRLENAIMSSEKKSSFNRSLFNG